MTWPEPRPPSAGPGSDTKHVPPLTPSERSSDSEWKQDYLSTCTRTHTHTPLFFYTVFWDKWDLMSQQQIKWHVKTDFPLQRLISFSQTSDESKLLLAQCIWSVTEATLRPRRLHSIFQTTHTVCVCFTIAQENPKSKAICCFVLIASHPFFSLFSWGFFYCFIFLLPATRASHPACFHWGQHKYFKYNAQIKWCVFISVNLCKIVVFELFSRVRQHSKYLDSCFCSGFVKLKNIILIFYFFLVYIGG